MLDRPKFEVYTDPLRYWLAIDLNKYCMTIQGPRLPGITSIIPSRATAKLMKGSYTKLIAARRNKGYRCEWQANLLELGFLVVEAVAEEVTKTAGKFGLDEAAVLTTAFGPRWPPGAQTTISNQVFVFPDSPVVSVTHDPWNI